MTPRLLRGRHASKLLTQSRGSCRDAGALSKLYTRLEQPELEAFSLYHFSSLNGCGIGAAALVYNETSR